MYFCGEVLRWSGQFDSALDQHLECLKFKKQLYRAAEDETKVGAPTDLARSSLAISYNRIGDMYASKQSRKKALQYVCYSFATPDICTLLCIHG